MLLDSILNSVKKMLGIVEDDTNFDSDIIIHINTVFMILNQLGVGPESTFTISDKYATWTDFINGQENIESVKTYIGLKVRVLFDPPDRTVIAEAINRSISELEWRLNASVDPPKDKK